MSEPRDLHSIANEIAGLRDRLDPLRTGMIKRGCACTRLGDLSLEPGLRKVKLKDAKAISEHLYARLNAICNELSEIDYEVRTKD